MNRLTREYLRTLVVEYHTGRGCGLWPQSCNGTSCNGHIGRINKEGDFEELSIDEYNFVKQKMGVPLNTRYYKVPHYYGKRCNRRGEVISVGISSPSRLFDFARMHEHRTYLDLEELIKKINCEVIEKDGCCCVCDPEEIIEE